MKKPVITLVGISVVLATGAASAALFRAPGVSCVEEASSAHIAYSSAAAAVNTDSAEAHVFHCSGTSISTQTLQAVTVVVVDQNPTQAVECTTFNGSFSTSLASVGASSTPQALLLDLPDASWADARVSCLVPRVSGGARSAINRIDFNTL